MFYFLVMSMQIPTATVAPESLIANLLSCGMSLFFSITSGTAGFTFTIAESPVFIVSGFSATVSPVAGFTVFTISVTWHATCAVCMWNTGVYPIVITLG